MIERYGQADGDNFTFTSRDCAIALNRLYGGIWKWEILFRRPEHWIVVLEGFVQGVEMAAFAAERETACLAEKFGKLCIRATRDHEANRILRVRTSVAVEKYEVSHKDVKITVIRLGALESTWSGVIAFYPPTFRNVCVWQGHLFSSQKDAMDSAIKQAAEISIALGNMAVTLSKER